MNDRLKAKFMSLVVRALYILLKDRGKEKHHGWDLMADKFETEIDKF